MEDERDDLARIHGGSSWKAVLAETELRRER
jgi:hypothetical protein